MIHKRTIQTRAETNAEGIVEAVVSAFGVLDSYGTRIMRGAFEDSLKERMPKILFHHERTDGIGVVEYAEELDAGDKRLPEAIRNYGGLFIRGRINLDTELGRDVFSNLQFGVYNEWSIGFEPVEEEPQSDGTINFTKVKLYEVSPVLVGANPLTATLAIRGTDDVGTQIKTLIADVIDNARAHGNMRKREGRKLSNAMRDRLGNIVSILRDAAADIDNILDETAPPERNKKAKLLLKLKEINL